jgi:hypothetical protein
MKKVRAPRAEAGVLEDGPPSSGNDHDLTADFDSPNQPSQEDIETLAYLMFLNEGGVHGNHLRHWREAERLLNGS